MILSVQGPDSAIYNLNHWVTCEIFRDNQLGQQIRPIKLGESGSLGMLHYTLYRGVLGGKRVLSGSLFNSTSNRLLSSLCTMFMQLTSFPRTKHESDMKADQEKTKYQNRQ